jgi:hypothetical protein
MHVGSCNPFMQGACGNRLNDLPQWRSPQRANTVNRMQRIERTGPHVGASQNDPASSGEQKHAGPSGVPSLGGPGELLKSRRNPATQEDAAASRIPVPPPLPPEGFNLSLPVKPRPAAVRLDGTEPLRDHEYDQAAYQLAAHAIGDPIEDRSDLAHLAAATETIHRTRVDLQHGRGNFKSDFEASKGASAVRTMVAFDMKDAYGANTGAGVALAYGAANCDMNAWINTRRYSAKLMEPGETVSTVGTDRLPHTWSELNRPDKPLADGRVERRPTIVLDSWADGPAVRLKDSSHAAYVPTTTADETFDRESARPHLEVMNRARLKASPGGSLHQEAEASLQRRTKRGGSFRQVFTEFPVLHADFVREAREALNAQSALTKELMAVAAGRNAYGLTVQQATHPDTSGAIAMRAVQLDKPTRPPIVDPGDKPT